MLISPTSVPAVIIHALLPVSSQLGTAQLEEATPAAHGKLLTFVGAETGACAWANAECAVSKTIRASRTTTGIIAFLLRRNLVSFIGKLCVSECASFTSPRLH